MITETYLNTCFTVILNRKTKVRKDKALFRDILDSLKTYKSKESKDVPINIKNKLDCLIKICEMKVDDRTDDNIIDSISFSEKYKNLIDYINVKRDEEIHETFILDNIKQIRLRKKLGSLYQNHDKLGNFVQTIKEGSFDSIDDLVLDYETIVKELYTNMMDANRGVSIEATSSLDLSKDDFAHVIDTIIKKYEKTNTTSTGFSILDNEVLNGGFEPSRLYIIGGSSGSGKSTILNNMMLNAATKPNPLKIDSNENKKEKNEKNVYVYITLENTIEESLMRLYQALFSKTLAEVLRDINNGVNMKEELMRELDKNNSTIIMKYFPAASISTLDIMTVLDDVINEYDKDSIKGLYIDYLDLLRSDIKYDIHRMELGHITVSLKSLAVEYNIPVITATQLGRSTYRIQNSNELSLDQMGESIKKVEHADFVALLAKDPVEDTIVHFKVGKNRNGRAGIALDFDVNFEIFKFTNARKLSNKNKSDVTSDNNMGFKGFGNF